jgi:ribosomal protein S18 acetylase RimI-like enzyme
MSPIQTSAQIFDAVQKVKVRATAFCTNFFPVESKLQSGIDRSEWFVELYNGATFFFRKDRNFWHFYFCAADAAALQREMAASPALKTEPFVTDLIGKETALDDLLPMFETAGFRCHSRLLRMARAGQTGQGVNCDLSVVFAEQADSQEILDLIENLFDSHGEQLPALYEVEVAVENHQIFVVKRDGIIAGLLFFETRGFASAIRFWAVAEKFRAAGVGSALMRHYFNSQNAVRHFNLWVNISNRNAIQRYQHYGYRSDGLLDQVMANEMIHHEIHR